MKAHRRSSDAFILILKGEGYSLTWAGENVEGRTRIDWRKGTLFVPPTYSYHQHLNPGTSAIAPSTRPQSGTTLSRSNRGGFAGDSGRMG